MIAGGGPAGSSTAYFLSKKGLKVLLLERTIYENWRFGETLPPQIKTSLSVLGIWPQFIEQKFSTSLQMQWIWGGEDNLAEYNFLRNPYGSPWHIDRKKFDLLLLNHAKSLGTEVLLHTNLHSVEKNKNGWKVKLQNMKNPMIVNSKFLVDASGKTSALARMLGVKRIRYDNLVGSISICKSKGAIKPTFLVEAVENGWWYSCPISPRRILVGYLTDGDYLSKISREQKHWWNNELLNSPNTAARVNTLIPSQEVWVGAAFSSILEKSYGEGWLAVGDSVSSFDPISGAGISKALHFAPQAANAISSAIMGEMLPIENYAAAVKLDFFEYRKQQQLVYQRELRWKDSLFWKRRC